MTTTINELRALDNEVGKKILELKILELTRQADAVKMEIAQQEQIAKASLPKFKPRAIKSIRFIGSASLWVAVAIGTTVWYVGKGIWAFGRWLDKL